MQARIGRHRTRVHGTVAAFTLVSMAACGGQRTAASTPVPEPRPVQAQSAVPANVRASIFARVPSQVAAYKLTERAVVRGTNDSLYRFSDGSPAIVTVFVYDAPPDVRADPDSQKWTAREGEKFRQVQEIRMQRGDVAAYTVAFADSERVAFGDRRILEHRIATPVRLRSGAIFLEFQYLYLIDDKLLKVRATIPEAGWQQTTVGQFARQLASQVATGDGR